MDFLSFLQAIGAATQLDIGAAATDGGCTIVFSDHLEVTFEYDEKSQAVLIFAPLISIGTWPLESRARILASVLEWHLFGLQTEGNYFGLDSQLDRIVFTRSLALASLEPTGAVQAVESFVNQLERWHAHLMQASLVQEPEPDPASSPLPIQPV